MFWYNYSKCGDKMENENLEKIVEAVLFALGREITPDELSATLEVEKEYVIEAIEKIEKKYCGDSGVILVKDTNPSISIIITETKTVKGFLTLSFGSKYFTSFANLKTD